MAKNKLAVSGILTFTIAFCQTLSAGTIEHLPQIHWAGPVWSGDDSKGLRHPQLDDMAKSQIQLVQAIRRQKGAIIYLEGQTMDLNASTLKEANMLTTNGETNEEMAKKHFPNGIPDNADLLSKKQKYFLAVNGGPEVMLYLGEISELKAGENPDRFNSISETVDSIKRQFNGDSVAAQFDPRYEQIVMRDREGFVFQKAKTELQQPENEGKSALIVFGANHDFSRFNSKKIPVSRADMGPKMTIQRLAQVRGVRPEVFELNADDSIEFWSEIRFVPGATEAQVKIATDEQKKILTRMKSTNQKIQAQTISALLTDELKMEAIPLIDPESISMDWEKLATKQFLDMLSRPSGRAPKDPLTNQALVKKAEEWLRTNVDPERTERERKSYEERLIRFGELEPTATPERREMSIEVQSNFLERLEAGDQLISEDAWNAIIDPETKKKWSNRVFRPNTQGRINAAVKTMLTFDFEFSPSICK